MTSGVVWGVFAGLAGLAIGAACSSSTPERRAPGPGIDGGPGPGTAATKVVVENHTLLPSVDFLVNGVKRGATLGSPGTDTLSDWTFFCPSPDVPCDFTVQWRSDTHTSAPQTFRFDDGSAELIGSIQTPWFMLDGVRAFNYLDESTFALDADAFVDATFRNQAPPFPHDTTTAKLTVLSDYAPDPIGLTGGETTTFAIRVPTVRVSDLEAPSFDGYSGSTKTFEAKLTQKDGAETLTIWPAECEVLITLESYHPTGSVDGVEVGHVEVLCSTPNPGACNPCRWAPTASE